MKFAAASIIAFAILAALAVADVATVKKDVANIDSQAASLDKKLQSEDGEQRARTRLRPFRIMMLTMFASSSPLPPH